MHILITGANGQLGSEMRKVSARGKDRYIFSDVNDLPGVQTFHLDITDEAAVRRVVQEQEIDVILNCAAYTNVDAAEENEALAARLNAEAPEILAKAISSREGLLIHISTDYVFGASSQRTPLREDDPTGPLGVYGRTKLEAEKRIAASACRHIIIRTAWLYSEFGKNFCKTMLSLTESRPEIKVVCDQIGTPTYALDLAKVIFHIIENKQFIEGIYHYTNEGVCSWWEFAKGIYSLARELDPKRPQCSIEPCTSAEFGSKVARPPYSVLDKSKIKTTFGIEIPSWRESLEHCLRTLKSKI